MRSINLIFVILLFITISYKQTHSQSVISSESKITLMGQIFQFDENEFKIHYILENKSGDSIYVATNPIRESGELGYYLLLDETDNSILKISSRVYPEPPYFLYSDSRRVELKKLKSGERYSESILIKLPTKETTPPYYGRALTNKKIIPEKIKQIELAIGYFVEEEGIVEFLQRKPFGWYVKGQEAISVGNYKDKSFLEIQNLTTVKIPVIENKDK